VQCSINEDADEGVSNMSSTTMQPQGFNPARPQAVGDALRELSTAAQRLATAMWAAFQPSHAPSGQDLTPIEEAAEVRNLATTYMKTDPGFAADLFAAADRHERDHTV
jgi:hypothetical protein